MSTEKSEHRSKKKEFVKRLLGTGMGMSVTCIACQLISAWYQKSNYVDPTSLALLPTVVPIETVVDPMVTAAHTMTPSSTPVQKLSYSTSQPDILIEKTRQSNTRTATTTPTATPTSIPTRRPADTPTSKATPWPTAEESNLFMRTFIIPLLQSAIAHRKEDFANPEIAPFLEPALNNNSLNVVVIGYGLAYEPNGDSNYKGENYATIQIIQALLKTLGINIIGITHDFANPTDKAVAKLDYFPKIDNAFFRNMETKRNDPQTRNFDLLRRTIIESTGIYPDIQIAIRDDAVQRFIDNVLGYLEVNVPFDTPVISTYAGNTLTKPRIFPEGLNRMTGTDVSIYIKAIQEVKDGETYKDKYENTKRLQEILEAIQIRMQKEVQEKNVGIITKASVFFNNEIASGAIKVERLDVPSYLGSVAMTLPASTNSTVRVLPHVNKKLYIGTGNAGGIGGEWAAGRNLDLVPLTGAYVVPRGADLRSSRNKYWEPIHRVLLYELGK